MPLTQEQIAELQKRVVQVENGPNHEGKVTIEITKGHPRRIYIEQTFYMPKPENNPPKVE